MKTEQGVSTEIPARVETEANEWFLRIRDGGLSEQDLNTWRCWLEQDVIHELAFQAVETLWRDLESLGDMPLPADTELEADAYDGNESVSQWIHAKDQQIAEGTARSTDPQDRSTDPQEGFLAALKQVFIGRQTPWLATAVASIAVAALAFVITTEAPSGKVGVESFQTAHAQHRKVTLQDGSVVELGAESILTVSFGADRRDVNLVRGEAYFQVTKDKSRPFTVQMGSGFVQVVGTAFNIDRDGRGSTVSVLEGHVRVARERLTLDEASRIDLPPSNAFTELLAGDQVIVDASGAVGSVSKVDVESSVAWREGLLVFINQSMGDVVSELNRYSKQRIILANSSVGSIGFTGTVDKERIEEWLTGLEKAYPIRVSIIDSNTVLLFDKTM